jgi:protein-tyrosine phosphatase
MRPKMPEKYSRHIKFENILNFRDIGGYRTRDGRAVAWRRIFRSGDPRRMTVNDVKKIKEKLGIAAVLDLRSPTEFEQRWEVDLLQEIGARYYNIPYRPGDASYYQKEMEMYTTCSNMGEVYLSRTRNKAFGKRVVESLEIIAVEDNHPLVFHCGAGKDRAGILAAFLLSALGVAENDIIKDYALTAPSMKEIRKRVNNDPSAPEDIKKLPDFAWEAAPESMALFLSTLKSECGSARGYLEANGAVPSLFGQLKRALLI